MKKFLTALFVLILFAATAQAAEPVRIARVPIIFQSTVLDDKARAPLEKKIERATHIPLNGYLQVAEYLPPEDCARALDDICREMNIDNRKVKLAEAMRPLADRLDADIIVCPILLSYYQTVVGFSNWYGDEFLNSHAAFELIVYDRRTDTLLDKKASRMHHDTMSALGTASHLAGVCLDIVIEKTKLRELIRAIGR